MKNNKYQYLYVLQGQYGFGWEDLTQVDKNEHMAWSKIRQDKNDYIANECGCYRIISRRELNQG